MSLGGGLVRRFLFVPAVVVAALIVAPTGAGAATSTVGQTFAPDPATNCGGAGSIPGVTFLQTEVASGNQYIVPGNGTITSWSFQTGSDLPSTLKFKVGRPQEDGSILFVGEEVAGALTPNAVNTYPANLPVEEQDIIGFFMGGSGGDCAITTADPNDTSAQYLSDPPVGAAPEPTDPQRSGFRLSRPR